MIGSGGRPEEFGWVAQSKSLPLNRGVIEFHRLAWRQLHRSSDESGNVARHSTRTKRRPSVLCLFAGLS